VQLHVVDAAACCQLHVKGHNPKFAALICLLSLYCRRSRTSMALSGMAAGCSSNAPATSADAPGGFCRARQTAHETARNNSHTQSRSIAGSRQVMFHQSCCTAAGRSHPI